MLVVGFSPVSYTSRESDSKANVTVEILDGTVGIGDTVNLVITIEDGTANGIANIYL